MVVNLLANSGTHTHFDDSEEEEDDVVINTVGKDKTATTSGRAKSGGAVRVSDSPAAAGRTKPSSKILVEQVDEVDTLQPATLISISFAIHHLATRKKMCTAVCRR